MESKDHGIGSFVCDQ